MRNRWDFSVVSPILPSALLTNRSAFKKANWLVVAVSAGLALVGRESSATPCAPSECDTAGYWESMAKRAETELVGQGEGEKSLPAHPENPCLWYTYAVALFRKNPNRYRDMFVRMFPVDSEGIVCMYDLERLSTAPEYATPFSLLFNIALSGNMVAIDKLWRGSVHTDGEYGEEYEEYMMQVFRAEPLQTVSVLSKWSSGELNAVFESGVFRTTSMTCDELAACLDEIERRGAGKTRGERRAIGWLRKSVEMLRRDRTIEKSSQ